MILIMVAHDVGETAVAHDERLYEINLVLAEVCQLIAVSIFTVLCIHFFSKDFQDLDEQTRSLEQEGAVVVVSLPEKTRELVSNMKLVGFLGVISWVICGIMHDALFSFAFVEKLPEGEKREPTQKDGLTHERRTRTRFKCRPSPHTTFLSTFRAHSNVTSFAHTTSPNSSELVRVVAATREIILSDTLRS